MALFTPWRSISPVHWRLLNSSRQTCYSLGRCVRRLNASGCEVWASIGQSWWTLHVINLRGSRVRFPAGAGNFFLFSTASRTALEPTQSSIQWVPRAFSFGVRGRGVKLTTHLHLLPRLKNVWIYASTPQYAFMEWCLVSLPLIYVINLINFVITQKKLIKM
jgi:hypothetical protein